VYDMMLVEFGHQSFVYSLCESGVFFNDMKMSACED